MANDITETQTATSAFANVFAMAIDAARDPTIDAEKMKLLVDMATTQTTREAERRYRLAKQAALLEMPSISKRGMILNKQGQPQSRYSKFEDIHRVVKPILAKFNLTISFNIGNNGNQITVQPILSYADAEVAFEERGGEMPLAIDTTGSKNATQGAGSAASYGKRHTMKAMLNIVEDGEDNDAQSNTEALAPELVALIDEARVAAMDGTEAYQAYSLALPKDHKGFLVNASAETGDTYHDQNKKNARIYD